MSEIKTVLSNEVRSFLAICPKCERATVFAVGGLVHFPVCVSCPKCYEKFKIVLGQDVNVPVIPQV